MDVGLLLRLLPKTQPLQLRPAPSGTAAGGGSSVSSAKSGINTASSSFDSSQTSVPRSSRALQRQSGKAGPKMWTTGCQAG